MDSEYIRYRISPLLFDGNCVRSSSLESMFCRVSEQEHEELLAMLAEAGIRICLPGEPEGDSPDGEAASAAPAARAAACSAGFSAAQLQGMSNEQLCMLAQHGDADANAMLCRKTSRFVHKMAQRVPCLLSSSSLTEEDAFQNGQLGLQDAVERFDASTGCSFLTYAAYWIRQRILREAICTGFPVRLPVHYFDTLCRIRSHCSAREQLHGPALWQSIAEAEKACGHSCTAEDVRRYLNDMAVYLNISSLDQTVDEEGLTPRGDLLPDRTAEDPADAADTHAMQYAVRKAVTALPPRERDVLVLRFGIGCVPQTLEEIGARLGVTRERVRQIQERGLTRLRCAKNTAMLAPFLCT